MAGIFASFAGGTVAVPNPIDFTARVATVVTSGTAIQLPSVVVPDGIMVVIRATASNKNKKIYLSNSSANVADATKRLILAAGESIGLQVADTNVVWIDSDSNNASIEFFVEQ